VNRSRLCGEVGGFVDNCRGASAIEFALILPLMLTLYIGATELGLGLAAQFKSTAAARTVADLASRQTTIDNPTMSSILGAAAKVIYPFPGANLVVVVSEVTTDAKGNGTITWSAAQNATPYQAGQSVKLPTALQIPNVAIILGEVTYPYTPPVAYAITGSFNIYQSTYFFPRKVSCVTYDNAC
jgi:Flp pilus assembly protein TadG